MRAYRPVIIASVAAAAFAVGSLRSRAPSVVAIPIAMPFAIPPPAVTVTPAQVVVAPAPPPPPAPVEALPLPPRALTPTLDFGCVIPSSATASPTCAWDDGFPAISADGTLIATKFSPDLGPSGASSLSIQLLDAKTSQVVRDLVITKADESYPFVERDEANPDSKAEQAYRKIEQAVSQRTVAAQRILDEKGFRSLIPLGSSRDNVEPSSPPKDRIYAEIVGSAVRIIDPKTSTVLWRGDFGAAGTQHPESDCGGWGLGSIEVWWDPTTKHVFASSRYRTGGCMCPDETVDAVR